MSHDQPSQPPASQATNQSSSTSKRGFWRLFITQAQGAFSDNAFKFLVTYLVMRSGGYSSDEKDALAPIIGAVFALPFILFSMPAGFLADCYSKRRVAIGTKIAEIIIMLLAVVGLILYQSIPTTAIYGLIVVVFLLSCQSAFFGPAKYGLLPELLPEKELSWGNGLLSLGTFVSIISGTLAAGFLSDWFRDSQVWSGVFLLVLALLGFSASLGIDRVPRADPNKAFRWNFAAQFIGNLRTVRTDRTLMLAMIGSAYFWFLAALLQLTVLFYGKLVLKLDDTQISFLMAALALGIGAGSAAAGYLSGKKIEYGLVPLGALGLSVFCALLALPKGDLVVLLVNLSLLGFFGGFYIVPLNALLQHRPDPKQKGSTIATNAILSFSGVFLASCAYYLFKSGFDMTDRQVFLFCSLLTLAGSAFIVTLLPHSLLRLILWLMTRSVYRITVLGRDNVPLRGGALIVCNHLSIVDALLVQAAIDRPIRFLMHQGFYSQWWVKPFAKLLNVIPISSQLRPRDIVGSLQTATDAINNGRLVCIFAEGQVTRIGQLLPFRRGFERIMKGLNAPIIPANLDGVWGSIFSFERGRFYSKWPHGIPHPVTVTFGLALPAPVAPLEVRQAVQELNSDAWRERKRRIRLLHRSFVRRARQHPRRFLMADGTTKPLNHISGLIKTVFLARRLRQHWADQSMVGLLLPPSVPGALVNWAALLMGKVPVNLNYTLTPDTLQACVDQCQLPTIVTSKRFLARLKMEPPGKLLFLEELALKPSFAEKCICTMMAVLWPVALLEKALGRATAPTADDPATIIFSSGSTGVPKGVVLSHYNVGSNIEQLGQTFALSGKDRLLGVLPFFHSFGFTGTLILPSVLGLGVVYLPNPLDAPGVGQAVHKHKLTFLLATPTFLQLYLRSCSPEQFASLHFVLTGAEKLPAKVTQSFEEKFGVRPVEGYGCTECSPVVAVNSRDFLAEGIRQIGVKQGRIGRPLPGVSVRIVDPDSREPVTPGQPGLLLVKGPNVMQGYLGQPEKTAAVLQDGWYNTGDIATLDDDGFLAITDRLSRFSKIGGEMVPHIKVEEKLQEFIETTDQCFAVTGLPDERKGERLVVLHTLTTENLNQCLEKLRASELPNLWKPRADQFIAVETLPYLGTGKLDLRRVREIAIQQGT